jgi:hypothetical protein
MECNNVLKKKKKSSENLVINWATNLLVTKVRKIRLYIFVVGKKKNKTKQNKTKQKKRMLNIHD